MSTSIPHPHEMPEEEAPMSAGDRLQAYNVREDTEDDLKQVPPPSPPVTVKKSKRPARKTATQVSNNSGEMEQKTGTQVGNNSSEVEQNTTPSKTKAPSIKLFLKRKIDSTAEIEQPVAKKPKPAAAPAPSRASARLSAKRKLSTDDDNSDEKRPASQHNEAAGPMKPIKPVTNHEEQIEKMMQVKEEPVSGDERSVNGNEEPIKGNQEPTKGNQELVKGNQELIKGNAQDSGQSAAKDADAGNAEISKSSTEASAKAVNKKKSNTKTKTAAKGAKAGKSNVKPSEEPAKASTSTTETDTKAKPITKTDANAASATETDVKAEPITKTDKKATSTIKTAKSSTKKLAADDPYMAVLPSGYRGTPSNLGTSNEKPSTAPNDVPWNCANRKCRSGQTWWPSDMGKYPARKVISNFFGRNKTETQAIHPLVWHNNCRNCYQRRKFNGDKNPKAGCRRPMLHVRVQIERLKLWRPQAKFQVQVTKRATARLTEMYRLLSTHNQNMSKVKEALTKQPRIKITKKKTTIVPLSLEDAFPVDLLKLFDDQFTGADKDYDWLDNILIWIEDRVEDGSITSMPPMEFLINAPAKDETINDPASNYKKWIVIEDAETQKANASSSDTADKAPVDDDQDGSTEYDGDDASITNDEGVDPTKECDESSTVAPLRVTPESDGDELHSVTDDEKTNSVTPSDNEDEPATPPTPAKKKFRLRLVDGYTAPLSSTYGAIRGSGIRKRPAPEEPTSSTDENGEEGASPPRKKQK